LPTIAHTPQPEILEEKCKPRPDAGLIQEIQLLTVSVIRMGCGSSTDVKQQSSRSILLSGVERQGRMHCTRLLDTHALQLREQDTERRQLCLNFASSIVTSSSQPQSSGDREESPYPQQSLPHLTLGLVHMPHDWREQRPDSGNTRPVQHRAPPRSESASDLLDSESSKASSDLPASAPTCSAGPLLPLNAQINFDQPEVCIKEQRCLNAQANHYPHSCWLMSTFCLLLLQA